PFPSPPSMTPSPPRTPPPRLSRASMSMQMSKSGPRMSTRSHPRCASPGASRRPRPVRWYYDVWTRLPEARLGLWGRGVIAVDDTGQERIADLPRLLGDDLAASLLFKPHERRIVTGARVVVD